MYLVPNMSISTEIRQEVQALVPEYLIQARKFTEIASGYILDQLGDELSVEKKHDKSVVTTIDTEVEKLFREWASEHYPDMGVIGEEYDQYLPEADYQWIIDPIDGTEELVHGLPLFGSIIGLFYKGRPLLGIIDHPALSTQMYASFGGGAFVNDCPLRLEDTPSHAPSLRMGITCRANFLRYGDETAMYDRLIQSFPNNRTYYSCYMHTAALTGGA